MALEFLDWIVIIIYFLIILYVGFFLARQKESSGNATIDFLLAGRKVTLPLFVATLVATWYGNILGMGEFVYKGGIAAWTCFAFPYYIAALLFAYFIAGKIRESNVKTIPEQIITSYGNRAGWLASFIVFLITVPATYVFMLGILINLFTGWSLWICIITGAVCSMAYLFTGGFRADILTNSVQFILMYVGFGILTYFTLNTHGSIGQMLDNLPANHKEFFGSYSWQYILSWFFIAMQTFVDPSFHQRCAAAKSPKTARRGIAVSVLFWMIFDSMTLLTGLYAKAYYITGSPVMAYPLLGDSVLPVVWKGLFIVALLATIMSSLDSFAFISAATIGNDILKPLKKFFKKLELFSTKALIKIGLVITAVISIILAIIIPSAVDLIYKTSSIAIPGLLLPMLISYNKNLSMKPSKAILIMIAASGTSFIWTFGKIFLVHFKLFSEIEPMIPGIFISIVLALIFTKKRIANE